MNILIVLGHPKPGSFNHAIAETAFACLTQSGHHVVFHDLYQERFDPVLPMNEENLPEEKLPPYLQNYICEIKNADGLIFIHPNWWGGPPAVLRGWIERVIRTDSCYNFTPNGVKSHISGKIVQIFSTSNTPHDVEMQLYGDPVEHFWKVIVFGLLGSKSFERQNFGPIVVSSPEDRKNWLEQVNTILVRRFRNGE